MKKILAVVVVLCMVFVGVVMAGPPRLESQVEFQKFVIGSQHNDQIGALFVTDILWKEGTALSVFTAVNFNESTLISGLTTTNIATTGITQCLLGDQKEVAIQSQEIVSGCCPLQQMQNSTLIETAVTNSNVSMRIRLPAPLYKADAYFKPVFHIAQKSLPATNILLC